MKGYIQVQQMKYERKSPASRATPVDSDKSATIKLANITSVHDEDESNHVYEKFCIVSMSNGKTFRITYETGKKVLKAWKAFLDFEAGV